MKRIYRTTSRQLLLLAVSSSLILITLAFLPNNTGSAMALEVPCWVGSSLFNNSQNTYVWATITRPDSSSPVGCKFSTEGVLPGTQSPIFGDAEVIWVHCKDNDSHCRNGVRPFKIGGCIVDCPVATVDGNILYLSGHADCSKNKCGWVTDENDGWDSNWPLPQSASIVYEEIDVSNWSCEPASDCYIPRSTYDNTPAPDCGSAYYEEITVFEHIDCNGSHIELLPGFHNLTALNFNDVVSSIMLPFGSCAVVYEDVDGSGQSSVIQGNQDNLLQSSWPNGSNMNDSISSIAIFENPECSSTTPSQTSTPTIMPEPSNDPVTVYEHENYIGTQYGFSSNTNGWFNLSVANGANYMNDVASSINLQDNWSIWVAEFNEGMGGRKCLTSSSSNLSNTTYDNGININDTVSSLWVFNDDACGGNGAAGVEPGDTITVYADPPYSGTRYGWHDAGSWNTPDYITNNITSIGVTPGWSIALFEGPNLTGGYICVNGSDPDLSNDTLENGNPANDNAESIQIFNNDNCTGLLVSTSTPAPTATSAPTATPEVTPTSTPSLVSPNLEFGPATNVTNTNADTSRQPRTYIDADGTIHMVYTEKLNGQYQPYYRSYHPSTGWSGPELIAQTNVWTGAPSVAVTLDGVVHVVWFNQTSNIRIYYASKAPGGSWSGITDLTGAQAFDSYSPTIVSDSNGTVHLVWLTAGTPYSCMYMNKPVGGTWSSYEEIPTLGIGCSVYDAAIDMNGVLHLAFHVGDHNGTARNVYHIQRNEGGSWSNQTKISNCVGNNEHCAWPIIEVYGTDLHVAYCYTTAWPNGCDVYYTSRINGNWQSSENLSNDNADSLMEPDSLTVDISGNVYICWSDPAEQDILCRLNADGIWSDEVMLSFANPIRWPAVTADTGGVLHLFFSEKVSPSWDIMHVTNGY